MHEGLRMTAIAITICNVAPSPYPVLLFKRKKNPSNTCPQCLRHEETNQPSAVLGEVSAPESSILYLIGALSGV